MLDCSSLPPAGATAPQASATPPAHGGGSGVMEVFTSFHALVDALADEADGGTSTGKPRARGTADAAEAPSDAAKKSDKDDSKVVTVDLAAIFVGHPVTPHADGGPTQQGGVAPDGHGEHGWTAADLAALLRGGRGATLPGAPGAANAADAKAAATADVAATAKAAATADAAANADVVATAAEAVNLSDTASAEKADRLTDAKVAQALAQRLLASGANANQMIEALSGQGGSRSKEGLDDLIRQSLLATEQKPGALNPASRLVVSLTSAAGASSSSSIAGGEVGAALGASGSLLPTETADQIIQTIRLQATRGGGEAQIRLEPNVFGEVTVSVHVDQGQVVARVSADTAVVREWLQANEHVLRQSMASQNLTLTRLEVSEPSGESRQRGPRDGNGSGTGQPASDEQPARRPRAGDTGETFDVVA